MGPLIGAVVAIGAGRGSDNMSVASTNASRRDLNDNVVRQRVGGRGAGNRSVASAGTKGQSRFWGTVCCFSRHTRKNEVC